MPGSRVHRSAARLFFVSGQEVLVVVGRKVILGAGATAHRFAVTNLLQIVQPAGDAAIAVGVEGVQGDAGPAMNDTEVAYLSNNKLYVTQAEILSKLIIGKFAFEPQSNGNLSLIYNG